MASIYRNFLGGLTTNDPLTAGGTTLNSAALANLPVVSAPDTMRLVLDPEGATGAPEVVLVTAHTSSATSATITRGQETSTAREHAVDTSWIHSATRADMDDLPHVLLTTTGDIIYASGANTPARLAIGAATTVLHGGTTPSYGQIVAGDIASDAVTTVKILDSNVTTAKIADLNVTTGKLADEAVTAAKLDGALPIGVVGYAQRTSDQTTITTEVDLTGLSVTFTAVSGRRYKATAYFRVSGTNTNDLYRASITDASDNILQFYDEAFWVVPGQYQVVGITYVSPNTVSGSTTYKLRMGRLDGTGSFSVEAQAEGPAFILVEDVGEF